jgi:Kef-type K+ transport system membrane component KefB
MLLGAFLAGVMLNGLPPSSRHFYYLEIFESTLGPLQEHVSLALSQW